MQLRIAGLVALAVALSGCGGQRAPSSRHLPPSVATVPTDAALLRVTRTNGTVELLQASTLAPREWLVSGGLPPIAHLLGSSAETKTVYASDDAGRLVSIDLVARKARIHPGSARQLSATPDGTILGLDSARHPTRFINGALVAFKSIVERGALLLRGPGDQIIAVTGKPALLQVLSADAEVQRMAVPNGRITTTWAGDLVAVTTDTAIVLIDPSSKAAAGKKRRGAAPIISVRMKGTPTVATFSPSGHRLYVARKKADVVMLDRFSHGELDRLALPGIADRLRVDRTGRWLLAHAATGDSLWVIDLSRWALAQHLVTPWSEDLPQVVDGHTLLMRNRADLVAIDLDGAKPPVRSVLVGGGGDLYLMLPWSPRATPLVSVSPGRPGDSAGVSSGSPATSRPLPLTTAGDSAAPTVVAPPAEPVHITPPESIAPATAVYLQVSSSQNQEWARTFAQQLKDGGFPAKVLEPRTNDEGYRVVIGPYASRTEAEAVGKRLGRSYFIISPGSGNT